MTLPDEEAHALHRSSRDSHDTDIDVDVTAGAMTPDEHPEPWTEKFAPFPEMKPPDQDTALVTVRAVLVGVLCGMLVNGSNIYLGLKTGWTSSANLLGSVLGFTLLSKSSQTPLGPHENNLVQTVATASAGLSNAFVSAIPATYQLGLLSTPSEDLVRILLLTAAGAYFGLLSVVSLRKFFIEKKSARDLNLVFPSSTVTALTIRSLHSAASRASTAVRQMRVTFWAFALAGGLRVLSPLATGVFWEWHVFTWLRAANVFTSFSMAAESWGWFVEWTPAMVGSGMLVDVNVAKHPADYCIRAVTGPYIVLRGIAFGTPVTSDPYWAGLMSYSSMAGGFASADRPSPRYWLLWPGVALMLSVSLTGLLCQWYSMIRSNGGVSISRFLEGMWRRDSYTALRDGSNAGHDDNDDQEEEEQEEESPSTRSGDIATWMWAPALVVAIAASVLSMKLTFGISVLKTLLALGLAFFLSLVAIQATGATDTTPLTAMSTVSQIVLSSTHAATGAADVALQQRLNLLGGALANMGASQACDLMGDFRVGFLLRTPAKAQYAGQLIGTLFAVVVAPVLFNLFTTAYPCIIEKTTTSSSTRSSSLLNNTLAAPSHRRCEFSGPSIATWRAVAVAASTGPQTAIPPSSGRFALLLAGTGVAVVLLQHHTAVKTNGLWRACLPNMMIMGLAFTMPSPPYALAMLTGALVARSWRRRRPGGFERYGSAVAAGLVAGEGIGGIVNGILMIGVGWGGEGWRWGTGVGCPGGRC
ncbi:hypothetical protein E4U55_007301 [Claviceps digitariae]|nr:hypothetical protein E4U55_007301 [Claviceps digitariae]